MMKRQASRRHQAERRMFRIKILAAAVLLVIFGFVVFSVPPEKLAWQGAYVMGTLLLPTPSQNPYVRPDAMRENSDSAFSLLAFFSVAGILGLAVKKIHENIPGGKPNGRKP
jgi:hypothetical protein